MSTVAEAKQVETNVDKRRSKIICKHREILVNAKKEERVSAEGQGVLESLYLAVSNFIARRRTWLKEFIRAQAIKRPREQINSFEGISFPVSASNK